MSILCTFSLSVSLSLSLTHTHTHTHNDRPHGMPRMLITRGDGTPNLITSPERGTSSYSTSIVMPEEEDAYSKDLLKRSVRFDIRK